MDPLERIATYQPQLDALLREKAEYERLRPPCKEDISTNQLIADYREILILERFLATPPPRRLTCNEDTLREKIALSRHGMITQEAELRQLIHEAEKEHALASLPYLEAYLIPDLARLVVEALFQDE